MGSRPLRKARHLGIVGGRFASAGSHRARDRLGIRMIGLDSHGRPQWELVFRDSDDEPPATSAAVKPRRPLAPAGAASSYLDKEE
jgi:hypothetical protein